MDNSAMRENPFHLSRWFALTGLLSIGLLSVTAAFSISHFLTDRMLRQEAVLTMEFFHSVVLVENAESYFRSSSLGSPEIASTFNHVAHMPDVLRASAHSFERRVIWSSDPQIVGRQFRDNPELERALAGELVVNEDFEEEHATKAEHASLPHGIGYFVEIYFPVRDRNGQIVGAVELYKTPKALFDAIRTAKQAVWIAAIGGGLFLYLTLFGLIRRADGLIRRQQEQLIQSETLAALGEMGSAVAHGIRNPLASIRSSAELSLETADALGREAANDIILEVDRLETWIRKLLGYARPIEEKECAVPVAQLVEECIVDFRRASDRHKVVVRSQVAQDVGSVVANPLLLEQVLSSLVANALEAIGEGQDHFEIIIGASREDRVVRIWVEDNGTGMGPDQLGRVFKPFNTTKPRGLGLGLPLARRIVERFGGRIQVASQLGRGTRVDLTLPMAQAFAG